jgi:hypothetical protein
MIAPLFAVLAAAHMALATASRLAVGGLLHATRTSARFSIRNLPIQNLRSEISNLKSQI